MSLNGENENIADNYHDTHWLPVQIADSDGKKKGVSSPGNSSFASEAEAACGVCRNCLKQGRILIYDVYLLISQADEMKGGCIDFILDVI